MSMNDKILHWFATGETGMSSKAMAACIAGIDGGRSHPYDPDDLNRCLLFLQAVPEAREHMSRLNKLSPTWTGLVRRWDEIESCFLEEAGLNWCNGESAPKTYDLMKEVRESD